MHGPGYELRRTSIPRTLVNRRMIPVQGWGAWPVEPGLCVPQNWRSRHISNWGRETSISGLVRMLVLSREGLYGAQSGWNAYCPSSSKTGVELEPSESIL
jgi:hypothetical protein